MSRLLNEQNSFHCRDVVRQGGCDTEEHGKPQFTKVPPFQGITRLRNTASLGGKERHTTHAGT